MTLRLIARITSLFAVFTLPVPALAQDSEDQAIEHIRSVLEATQPDMPVMSIGASPVPDLYVITLSNLQTIFVTGDARYFIPGDLFEALPDGMGMVNRGDEMRNQVRIERIAAVPESEMIIFPATGEEKASLSVFTDVDCPYCRRLHGDITQLNEMGITIRYLGFPREGLDAPTYDTMVSVWCSEDPNLYFTIATRGGEVPEASCETPIASHYALGHQLGVEGTPALLFGDGTLVNGYIEAPVLGEYLLGTESE